MLLLSYIKYLWNLTTNDWPRIYKLALKDYWKLAYRGIQTPVKEGKFKNYRTALYFVSVYAFPLTYPQFKEKTKWVEAARARKNKSRLPLYSIYLYGKRFNKSEDIRWEKKGTLCK